MKLEPTALDNWIARNLAQIHKNAAEDSATVSDGTLALKKAWNKMKLTSSDMTVDERFARVKAAYAEVERRLDAAETDVPGYWGANTNLWLNSLKPADKAAILLWGHEGSNIVDISSRPVASNG